MLKHDILLHSSRFGLSPRNFLPYRDVLQDDNIIPIARLPLPNYRRLPAARISSWPESFDGVSFAQPFERPRTLSGAMACPNVGTFGNTSPGGCGARAGGLLGRPVHLYRYCLDKFAQERSAHSREARAYYSLFDNQRSAYKFSK
jgi:hypothetical protein